MPEDVLFKLEEKHTRAEVAGYLRKIADKLEAGGPIALRAGDSTLDLDPPDQLTLEIKAEREYSKKKGPENAKLSLEIELEWRESESGKSGSGGGLEID